MIAWVLLEIWCARPESERRAIVQGFLREWRITEDTIAALSTKLPSAARQPLQDLVRALREWA